MSVNAESFSVLFFVFLSQACDKCNFVELLAVYKNQPENGLFLT